MEDHLRYTQFTTWLSNHHELGFSLFNWIINSGSLWINKNSLSYNIVYMQLFSGFIFYFTSCFVQLLFGMKEQCEMGIKEFVLPVDDPGQYSEIIWKIQSESKIKLRSYDLHFRQLLKTVWTSRNFAFTSIGFRVRIFATKSPFLIFCLIVG